MMNKVIDKSRQDPFSQAFYTGDPSIRTNYWVSSKSKWTDDVWRMDHATPGVPTTRSTIYWKTMDGDPSVIEDCKLFIWSLLTENMRGKAIKTTSLAMYNGSLKRLLRWMRHCGIMRFSDLPERFGYLYLEYLMEAVGNAKLTDSTIGGILDTPVKIYEHVSILMAAGRDGIRVHPYGGGNPYKIAQNYGPHPEHIPPIPDKLFVAVCEEVFYWTESYSTDIARAAVIAAEARNNVVRYGNWRAYTVNRALKGFRFHTAEGGEWRVPLGDNPTSELRELLSDLRTACLIAIQAFTGIRINEVLSLEAEPRHLDTGWPSCLTMRSSKNGLMDIFHIKGRIAKARDEFDEVEWIAGARPAGSLYLPPPVKAIIVLEETYRSWRHEKTTRLAINNNRGGRGLPDKKSMQPMLYRAVALGQIQFIQKYIYSKNPKLAEEVDWWNVSTHQWRKAFAQYVVRSDESLLRAVSEHYKHVSLAMTSEDYIGNDIELLHYLDDEGLQRASEIMIDLASHSTYGSGPLADLIQDRSEAILGLGGVGTRQAKVQAIKETLEGDNVRSWSCGWGDCIFRPETARCHLEIERNVDLSKTRPNTAVRRPSLCCDCQNLIVLKEHEPFWRRREQENIAILNREKDTNSGIARTAKSRVDQCRRILTKLDRAKKKVNVK